MESLAQRLLQWYDRNGRHDLPWQHPRTPYRTWVAEIMLQQTTVATVVPYFRRFLDTFPDLDTLAAADPDRVLSLWSGLGYYARGRNLHAAAQRIRDDHGGEFPRTREALEALPGIGRSTAAAILAQAFGLRHPILDGNVKRVLSRLRTVPGWPGSSRTSRALWTLAEELTPHQRVADYTQAIMDLGATCCTRNRPDCSACPWRADCAAHRQGRVTEFPAPRPRPSSPRRRRAITLLLLRDDAGQLLLEQRPPSGIWGGLRGFPEIAGDDDLETLSRRLGGTITIEGELPPLTHALSHFDMVITPVLGHLHGTGRRCMDGAGQFWYKAGAELSFGVAAPVRDLLDRLADTDDQEATWLEWCNA